MVIDQRENRPLLPLQYPAYFHWINFSASFPSCAVIPSRSKFSFKLFYCDVAVSVRFHSRCRLRKRLPGFPWVHTSLILGNQTFCPLRCPRASSRDVAWARCISSRQHEGTWPCPEPPAPVNSSVVWVSLPFCRSYSSGFTSRIYFETCFWLFQELAGHLCLPQDVTLG